MNKPHAERAYREREVEARALIEQLAAGGDLAELMPRIQALAAAFQTRRGATEASIAAAAGAKAAITADYEDFIFPILRSLRQEGIVGHSRTADTLNTRAIKSFSGKPWKMTMVQKLVKRLEAHDAITTKGRSQKAA